MNSYVLLQARFQKCLQQHLRISSRIYGRLAEPGHGVLAENLPAISSFRNHFRKKDPVVFGYAS